MIKKEPETLSLNVGPKKPSKQPTSFRRRPPMDQFRRARRFSPSFCGRAQMSVVKVHFDDSDREGKWKAHGQYLARKGTQKEGEKSLGFNHASNDIDIASLLDGWEKAGDERVFRVVISPENAAKVDLESHTQKVIKLVEQDLGTTLEWVGVIHTNTDNAHVHVAIRGRDDKNKSLWVDSYYLHHGIRMRSETLLTATLGVRTQKDVIRARLRSLAQERLTPLDRIILKKQSKDGMVSYDLEKKAHPVSVEKLTEEIKRLTFLEGLGVVERVGEFSDSTNILTWRVLPHFEKELTARQKAKDVVQQKILKNRNDKLRRKQEREAQSSRTANFHNKDNKTEHEL